ncbi:hypothetical protein N5C79_07600 [Pantoea brenneri]|uniref:hypothetical protein n=1 Tax=Pantoea brenneri TaxID=472694 RepID=UPI002446FF6D|nr:hypothetical protein [Pantoea brenneri]MDH1086346.1 hypothetical protein [Pantoea brenneri]
MQNESVGAHSKRGNLAVTYSNDEGGVVGVEFSSTTQQAATAIFGICASAMGEGTRKLVSSASSGDTKKNTPDGGDNMERRIAVLEADVAHIKSDVAELKSDQKLLVTGVADLKSDVKVMIQQLTDISSKLSEKSSKDNVDTKVGEIKIWMLGLLFLSVAMPTIFFLINLYLKKS